MTVDDNDFRVSRDELCALLEGRGIETRPFFLPLHGLPPFREGSLKRNEMLPITDRLAATGLNLPTHGMMTDDDVDRVIVDVLQIGSE